MKLIKFGVFIRSIEERTEKLCYESIVQHISPKQVHILRNYFPSYKTYLQMFNMAKDEKYDWYLGIDADVVLKKGWLDIICQKIEIANKNNLFRFYFYVKDFHTKKLLVRGNNFYNGIYTDFCLKYLKKNIKIGQFWFYYKYRGYSSGYFTKPETSIRTHMKNELNILDKTFNETIGWHGFEQYYAEVFRQYLTRYQRDYNFNKNNDFLLLENQEKLVLSNDIERYVANLAWNQASNWKIKTIDARIREKIKIFLLKKGIKEKEPIAFSLEGFYNKWLNF